MNTTHDYTKPTWGHAVQVYHVEGTTARVLGFGLGVREGDFLLLPNQVGSTRYQIKSVKYGRPADCWTADIEFAPREVAA